MLVTLGVLVDARDLGERIATGLRIGAELLPGSGDAALAVGLFGLGLVSEGPVADLGRRTTAAMAGFLRYGEDAAVAMVRHPGIAEKVVERAGEPAVRAMLAVNPQNGRRLAMLMEGELGKAAKSKELLEVVAHYGDRGAAFVWNHKGALATGAALTAFVANPEVFISGAKDITKIAGESTVGVAKVAGEHVVAPVVGGVFTAVNWLIGVIAVVIVGAVALMWKHGVPSPDAVRAAKDAIRK